MKVRFIHIVKCIPIRLLNNRIELVLFYLLIILILFGLSFILALVDCYCFTHLIHLFIHFIDLFIYSTFKMFHILTCTTFCTSIDNNSTHLCSSSLGTSIGIACCITGHQQVFYPQTT